MEIVSSLIKGSLYDAQGRNLAIQQALTRADGNFVDRDGWVTHVRVNSVGGANSGYYEMVSTAQVQDARARVSALIRERASYADYVWFVNRHNLGIAGGRNANFPYADAPEGNIHSNQQVHLYFANRHFKDPVTASMGFQYLSGATADNTYFHGPKNSAAPAVAGLTSVVAANIGQRSDALLNLTGTWDYAKVKMLGPVVNVEHWQSTHNETQLVAQQVPVYRTETRQVEQLQTVTLTGTRQVAVYSTRQVWQNDPYYVTITDQAGYYRTEQQQVRVAPFQVWVEDTGSGSAGGGAVAGGGSGYWQTVYNYQTQNVQVWVPPVTHQELRDNWHWVTQSYVSGYTTETYTYTQQQSYSPPRYTTESYQVLDRYETQYVNATVSVTDHKVATYNLDANGTMYVKGDVQLSAISSGGWQGRQHHMLDGSFTIASGDDIEIRDTIQYGKLDPLNQLQTAFLNGADQTKEYEKNPNYTGTSVLGLIAHDDIQITSNVPDQFEMNATVLTVNGEFRVNGTDVNSAGTVSATSSGSFVKTGMRSLGGVISNQRPVTTFVDSSNTVTRGFRAAKTVYDVRQRTNPPRGFPTLNKPRVLAQVVREVN
jgi:hypothetical protein